MTVAGHWGFIPAFEFELKYWRFVGLESSSFWTGAYAIGTAGSQAFGLEMEQPCWISWITSLLTTDLRTYWLPSPPMPIPSNLSLDFSLSMHPFVLLTNTEAVFFFF